MRIPTKMFRDTAAAKILLISPAHHRIFQYVITNQTVEISIDDRLVSIVVVSEFDTTFNGFMSNF